MQHAEGETTCPAEVVLGGHIGDGHAGAVVGGGAGVLQQCFDGWVVAVVDDDEVVEGAALVGEDVQGAVEDVRPVVGDDDADNLHAMLLRLVRQRH